MNYLSDLFSLPASGFFSGVDSSQMAEFLKASSAMRDSHRFAHTTDLSLGLKHGVESVCVVAPLAYNPTWVLNLQPSGD